MDDYSDDDIKEALKLSLQDQEGGLSPPSNPYHEQSQAEPLTPSPLRALAHHANRTAPQRANTPLAPIDTLPSPEILPNLVRVVLAEDSWLTLLPPVLENKTKPQDDVNSLISLAINNDPTELATQHSQPISIEPTSSAEFTLNSHPTPQATRSTDSTSNKAINRVDNSVSNASADRGVGASTFSYSSDLNLNAAFGVLFGTPDPVLTHQEFSCWFDTVFEFGVMSTSKMTLGLVQKWPGPCGVLVPLQCWILFYASFLRPALLPDEAFQLVPSFDSDSLDSLSTSSSPPPDIPTDTEDAIDSKTTTLPTSPLSNSQVPPDYLFHPPGVDPPSTTPTTARNVARDEGRGREGIASKFHQSWCSRARPSSLQSNLNPSAALVQLASYFHGCKCIQKTSLVWALCVVLYRATESSHYTVVVPTDYHTGTCKSSVIARGCKSSGIASGSSVTGSKACTKGTTKSIPIGVHSWSFNYSTFHFSTISSVYSFYLSHYDTLLVRKGSLLSFLLSLILTKKIDILKLEMDDPSVSLIGLYGHSSQELVNLLLTGRGNSNVFDNSKNLGLNLKGIVRNQIIGYLTELEAMRYCEVGHFFKVPKTPIWVVGSLDHFTTLFSLDPRVARISFKDQIRKSLCVAFDQFDFVSNSGLLPNIYLKPLLAATGLSMFEIEARRALDPPGQGGVILRMEFLEWAEKKLLKKSSNNQSVEINQTTVNLNCPSKFVLYHYDGQGTPGPSLLRIFVDQTPSTATASSTIVGNAASNTRSAFSGSGLNLALKTKWKDATFDSLPVLH